MSTSQVLDRTFYLYRNHFVLFAGIAIITPALRLIAELIQLKVFGRLVMPESPEEFTPEFMKTFLIRLVIALVVGGTIYIVGTALASGATAYAVSMVHLGKTTTIAGAYGNIKGIFGRILGLVCTIILFTFGPLMLSYGAFLGFGVAVIFMARSGNFPAASALLVLGNILFGLALIVASLVWMFFALCRYALAVPACTLEKLPIRPSIRRSKFLTVGAKGKILGVILLTWLMSFILAYVLQLPALLASSSVFLTGKTQLGIAATIWIYIAGFLGSTIAGPITTVAVVLIYYDQRVRKEAFDLQLMMEAVGQQPQPSVATYSGPPIFG